jgi:tetratricopeptide (TPR) repeat protein
MSDVQQLIKRGREAFERSDYASALSDFQEVLRQTSRFADVHHMTGLCLNLLGHPEAALREFDQAIALNGRYVEAHINRALTLNELGRFDEAQRAFANAAEFESEFAGPFSSAVSAQLATAHAQLGDLYLAAGAMIEAGEQYRAALDLRPQYHDIRIKLAQALMQTGESEAAARELRTVVDANPRFLAARLNLGLVYFRLGDRERAQREWESAQQQHPTNPQVRAYLAVLERGAGPSAAP